jgi:hypothetical protein
VKQAIASVVLPTLEFLADNAPDFVAFSAANPALEAPLILLMLRHPNSIRQEWAAHKLREMPEALAVSAAVSAVQHGIGSEAQIACIQLICSRCGGGAATAILTELRSYTDQINDVMIQFAASFPESPSAGRVPFSLKDLMKPSLLGVQSGEQEDRFADVLGEDASKGNLNTERLAFEASILLRPFSSQKLKPEQFDPKHLLILWRTFSEDLPMKALAATWAAFQADPKSRELVFSQITELDEMMGDILVPLVEAKLPDAVWHMTDEEYLRRCAQGDS